jgi:DNA polymerase-3 subunit epsilon
MERLAGEGRFEEAGLLRDRVRALVAAMTRARFEGWFVAPETLVLAGPDGVRYRFHRGRLGSSEGVALPVPPADADEVAAVRTWLSRNPVRVVEASGGVAEPVDGGRRLWELGRRIDRALSGREDELVQA